MLWKLAFVTCNVVEIIIVQGRQFVLKSGGDKRSDEKTLQQDGENIE